MSQFYIIDGNSYLHRAYHALPPLTTSKGEMVNAIYGFLKMVLKIIKMKKPGYLAICFDHPSPTFRHKQFADYKAQRKKMDDELKNQMPIAREAARALNIISIEREGYEADDIIATLASKAANDGEEVVVVTADKDALQLVGGNIKVWNEGKDILYGSEEVTAKYGLAPGQLVDMFALMGDSSDNVPGIKGIGEKTAVKLIQKFGNLETIFKNSGGLEGKLKELISGGEREAIQSRELVTLRDNVEIETDWRDCAFKPPIEAEVVEFLQKYEFKSLLNEIIPHSGASNEGLKHAPEIVVVLKESELAEIIKNAKERKLIAISTVTSGAFPLKAELAGIAVSFEHKKAFYVPLAHSYPGAQSQISIKVALGALKHVFEDESVKKYGQDIKRDILALKQHGIIMAGIYFDTMIASYCLNPTQKSHGIESIIFDHFGYKMTEMDELTGRGAKEVAVSGIEIEKVAQCAGSYASAVLLAAEKFTAGLKEKKIENLFYAIEMPLVEILALMEWHGIKVDMPYTERIRGEFEESMKGIEKDAYTIAGQEFNLNSPKQLAVILFEKLGLPVIKKTKTGFGTDEEVLKTLSMQNALPAKILQHRELQKLKSTYIDSILELADKKTHRIHTLFNQAVTATGRLSSSSPNMQNIPVRTEYGRKIRKCFIAEKGHSLLSADYSQIDLRMLAHITGDEALKKAFLENKDIHSATAREVFNVVDSDVTPELRRIAKSINFGIVYGMSSFSLSQQLEISPAKAKEYIDNYFARYIGVKRWMEEIVRIAREKGFVTTVTGRIRNLPEINSKNAQIRSFAERMALNTPIQGSSADIIKIAMIDIQRYLKENDCGSRMLLQVHDELLFEVPESELKEIVPEIKNRMENAMKLDVPIKTDVKAGPDWNSMEKLNV